MYAMLFFPILAITQTYRTTSQGGNYTGSRAYVAPVVTKTYTVPVAPAPKYSYPSPSPYKSPSGSSYNTYSNPGSSSYSTNSYDRNTRNIERKVEAKTPEIAKKPVRTSKYDLVFSYNNGLAVAMLNDKFGLIDRNEKEIIPLRYDFMSAFSEGLADVRLGKKWGFINAAGAQVIPFIYDFVYGFQSGMALVSLNNKVTYIDKTGKEIFPFKYDYLSLIYEGLIEARLNNKVGYLNPKGIEVIAVKYDSVKYQPDGGKRMFLNGDHYFFDKNGKHQPNLVDWVGDYDEDGVASVSLNNKFGRTDLKGKVIIPIKYDDLMPSEHGMTGVLAKGKWGFYNAAGKEVIKPQYDSVVNNFNQFGHALVIKAGKKISIGKNGNVMAASIADNENKRLENAANKVPSFRASYAELGEFIDGIAFASKDGKWGYVNTKGVVVVPLIYGFSTDFEYGMGCVELNDKWGFVNKTGKVVIPIIYENVDIFSNGLASVMVNGKWGYINTAGTMVIKPQFTTSGRFSKKGVAPVTADGLYFMITKEGKKVPGTTQKE